MVTGAVVGSQKGKEVLCRALKAHGGIREVAKRLRVAL